MFRLLLAVPAVLISLVWSVFFPSGTSTIPVATASSTDADAPSAESQEDGHELSDASPKIIALFVVGLFVTIFFAMATLGWMYMHLYAKGAAMPVRPRQQSFKHSASARTSIAKDWNAIDTLAHQRLDGYGWMDRTNGSVRIPIARAVELVAKEGLPARAGQPPDFPSPNQEKLPLQELERTTNANSFDPH